MASKEAYLQRSSSSAISFQNFMRLLAEAQAQSHQNQNSTPNVVGTCIIASTRYAKALMGPIRPLELPTPPHCVFLNQEKRARCAEVRKLIETIVTFRNPSRTTAESHIILVDGDSKLVADQKNEQLSELMRELLTDATDVADLADLAVQCIRSFWTTLSEFQNGRLSLSFVLKATVSFMPAQFSHRTKVQALSFDFTVPEEDLLLVPSQSRDSADVLLPFEYVASRLLLDSSIVDSLPPWFADRRFAILGFRSIRALQPSAAASILGDFVLRSVCSTPSRISTLQKCFKILLLLSNIVFATDDEGNVVIDSSKCSLELAEVSSSLGLDLSAVLCQPGLTLSSCEDKKNLLILNTYFSMTRFILESINATIASALATSSHSTASAQNVDASSSSSTLCIFVKNPFSCDTENDTSCLQHLRRFASNCLHDKLARLGYDSLFCMTRAISETMPFVKVKAPRRYAVGWADLHYSSFGEVVMDSADADLAMVMAGQVPLGSTSLPPDLWQVLQSSDVFALFHPSVATIGTYEIARSHVFAQPLDPQLRQAAVELGNYFTGTSQDQPAGFSDFSKWIVMAPSSRVMHSAQKMCYEMPKGLFSSLQLVLNAVEGDELAKHAMCVPLIEYPLKVRAQDFVEQCLVFKSEFQGTAEQFLQLHHVRPQQYCVGPALDSELGIETETVWLRCFDIRELIYGLATMDPKWVQEQGRSYDLDAFLLSADMAEGASASLDQRAPLSPSRLPSNYGKKNSLSNQSDSLDTQPQPSLFSSPKKSRPARKKLFADAPPEDDAAQSTKSSPSLEAMVSTRLEPSIDAPFEQEIRSAPIPRSNGAAGLVSRRKPSIRMEKSPPRLATPYSSISIELAAKSSRSGQARIAVCAAPQTARKTIPRSIQLLLHTVEYDTIDVPSVTKSEARHRLLQCLLEIRTIMSRDELFGLLGVADQEHFRQQLIDADLEIQRRQHILDANVTGTVQEIDEMRLGIERLQQQVIMKVKLAARIEQEELSDGARALKNLINLLNSYETLLDADLHILANLSPLEKDLVAENCEATRQMIAGEVVPETRADMLRHQLETLRNTVGITLHRASSRAFLLKFNGQLCLSLLADSRDEEDLMHDFPSILSSTEMEQVKYQGQLNFQTARGNIADGEVVLPRITECVSALKSHLRRLEAADDAREAAMRLAILLPIAQHEFLSSQDADTAIPHSVIQGYKKELNDSLRTLHSESDQQRMHAEEFWRIAHRLDEIIEDLLRKILARRGNQSACISMIQQIFKMQLGFRTPTASAASSRRGSFADLASPSRTAAASSQSAGSDVVVFNPVEDMIKVAQEKLAAQRQAHEQLLSQLKLIIQEKHSFLQQPLNKQCIDEDSFKGLTQLLNDARSVFEKAKSAEAADREEQAEVLSRWYQAILDAFGPVEDRISTRSQFLASCRDLSLGTAVQQAFNQVSRTQGQVDQMLLAGLVEALQPQIIAFVLSNIGHVSLTEDCIHVLVCIAEQYSQLHVFVRKANEHQQRLRILRRVTSSIMTGQQREDLFDIVKSEELKGYPLDLLEIIGREWSRELTTLLTDKKLDIKLRKSYQSIEVKLNALIKIARETSTQIEEIIDKIERIRKSNDDKKPACLSTLFVELLMLLLAFSAIQWLEMNPLAGLDMMSKSRKDLDFIVDSLKNLCAGKDIQGDILSSRRQSVEVQSSLLGQGFISNIENQVIQRSPKKRSSVDLFSMGSPKRITEKLVPPSRFTEPSQFDPRRIPPVPSRLKRKMSAEDLPIDARLEDPPQSPPRLGSPSRRRPPPVPELRHEILDVETDGLRLDEHENYDFDGFSDALISDALLSSVFGEGELDDIALLTVKMRNLEHDVERLYDEYLKQTMFSDAVDSSLDNQLRQMVEQLVQYRQPQLEPSAIVTRSEQVNLTIAKAKAALSIATAYDCKSFIKRLSEAMQLSEKDLQGWNERQEQRYVGRIEFVLSDLPFYTGCDIPDVFSTHYDGALNLSKMHAFVGLERLYKYMDIIQHCAKEILDSTNETNTDAANLRKMDISATAISEFVSLATAYITQELVNLTTAHMFQHTKPLVLSRLADTMRVLCLMTKYADIVIPDICKLFYSLLIVVYDAACGAHPEGQQRTKIDKANLYHLERLFCDTLALRRHRTIFHSKFDTGICIFDMVSQLKYSLEFIAKNFVIANGHRTLREELDNHVRSAQQLASIFCHLCDSTTLQRFLVDGNDQKRDSIIDMLNECLVQMTIAMQAKKATGSQEVLQVWHTVMRICIKIHRNTGMDKQHSEKLDHLVGRFLLVRHLDTVCQMCLALEHAKPGLHSTIIRSCVDSLLFFLFQSNGNTRADVVVYYYSLLFVSILIRMVVALPALNGADSGAQALLFLASLEHLIVVPDLQQPIQLLDGSKATLTRRQLLDAIYRSMDVIGQQHTVLRQYFSQNARTIRFDSLILGLLGDSVRNDVLACLQDGDAHGLVEVLKADETLRNLMESHVQVCTERWATYRVELAAYLEKQRQEKRQLQLQSPIRKPQPTTPTRPASSQGSNSQSASPAHVVSPKADTGSKASGSSRPDSPAAASPSGSTPNKKSGALSKLASIFKKNKTTATL